MKIRKHVNKEQAKECEICMSRLKTGRMKAKVACTQKVTTERNGQRSTEALDVNPADLLEDSFYYSVCEGMIAISNEVLLADQEVMVVVQFPELQHSMLRQTAAHRVTIKSTYHGPEQLACFQCCSCMTIDTHKLCKSCECAVLNLCMGATRHIHPSKCETNMCSFCPATL